MTLASVLHKASTLPADAPADIAQDLLSKLRAALTEGMDAHRDELRVFLVIADRFGNLADVWNASRLLGQGRDLEATEKAMQVSAWLRLFPEAARTRPRIALSLLGHSGRGPLSDSELSGLLSRWLDYTLASPHRPVSADVVLETLLATTELALCWWPPQEWPSVAPAFASAFVEAARWAAKQLPHDVPHESTGLTRVFRLALLLHDVLGAVDESETQMDEPVPSDTRPSQDPLDDMASLIARLNESRKRIWVVGALQPKWEHLMGVAKSQGIYASIFEHIDYDDLKSRSLLDRVDLVRDFGVLLGPIPHKVADLGGYSSLATQLKKEAGIGVVELRAQSDRHELKITKTSFRSGLNRLLADASVNGWLT